MYMLSGSSIYSTDNDGRKLCISTHFNVEKYLIITIWFYVVTLFSAKVYISYIRLVFTQYSHTFPEQTIAYKDDTAEVFVFVHRQLHSIQFSNPGYTETEMKLENELSLPHHLQANPRVAIEKAILWATSDVNKYPRSCLSMLDRVLTQLSLLLVACSIAHKIC